MSSLDWLLDTLRRRSRLRLLQPGEALFRQGDRTVAIFEVKEGRLRLICHTIDNHPVSLHTGPVGELFAEAALFAERYHCDAVVHVESCVHAYPKRVNPRGVSD